MTDTTPPVTELEDRYADAIRSFVTAVKEAERAKRKYQAETARKWAKALEQLAATLDS